MEKMRIYKVAILALFLLAISLPYLIHLSQDLWLPVCWDEATLSLNAKDIVLFGPASIKDDRSSYVLFPFKTLLGLLSFPLFGVSLFSLRLPYALLSVLGNTLFFFFVRKTTNTLIAIITTAVFVFYPVHLVMGKSGMSDSLILSLALIALWFLGRGNGKSSVYFWLGMLGTLIIWGKFDNIAVSIFLVGFTLLRSYQEKKAGNQVRSKRIIIAYALGVGLISLIAGIFYALVGWQNTMFWVKHLVKGSSGTDMTACSLKLLLQNISKLYEVYPCISIITMVCLTLFICTLIFSKKSRRSPLTCGILFFVLLLFGKLYISVLFFERRFTPCFPLLFLLMAHNAFFMVSSPLQAYSRKHSQLGLIKPDAIDLFVSFLVAVLLFVPTYMMYSPDLLKSTKQLIFHPTYYLLKEAKLFSAILEKDAKVLFLDGRFGYLAIQLPNKFIDIPPDLNAKEVEFVESNPPLAREMIKNDPQIKYVIFRGDNLVLKRLLEEELHAGLVAFHVTEVGLLYRVSR